MFASKFSNNKRFMAPRGEFSKPCNIHYYYYNPEYADMDSQNEHVITFNLMNKMNLTSNILTNKYFSQKSCNQNFDEGLKGFVVGPLLDATNAYTNCSNVRVAHLHPTNMQPINGNAHKISDMYTYLIDLIRRFFSSWKGPEQEQNLTMSECSKNKTDYYSNGKNNNIDKNIHLIEDCDLINNESNCIVTKKDNENIENSTKNRKICCDTVDKSTLNSVKPCLKMKTEEECKTMDDYDLGSFKYSREVNRLKSLKKKKQRRMAAQERKNHYNLDTNRRWQHNNDWIKNKIDIKHNLDVMITTKKCKSEYRNSYDDVDVLKPEKGAFSENCRNIVHSSPTVNSSSMPLVINTNSLVVITNQIVTSPYEDSHRIRSRNVSECESEDSFIVFAKDDNVCDDEQSEFDDGESFDDYTTEDDEDIQISQTTHTKKVSFADGRHLCQVHHLVKWSYAHQAARKGPWEECARDRVRFMSRIKNLEPELVKVFDPKLRERIYSERFAAETTKSKI